MSSEEFGPWIEHDGRGRPDITGRVVEIEYADGVSHIMLANGGKFFSESPKGYSGPRFSSSWEWLHPGHMIPVIRYRKPRGLTVLEEIARNVPAPKHVAEPVR